MNPIFSYLVHSAKRDRLFLGAILCTFLSLFVGMFLGQNSLVEQEYTKIVYTAGLSRNFLMLGFIVFVCLFVDRMFQNKEINIILSRPISRTKILISIFSGFVVILLFMCLPVVLSMVVVLNANLSYVGFWFATLILEGVMCLSFTLAYALIINSQFIAIVGSIISYLVCRMIGEFVFHADIYVTNIKFGIGLFFETLATTTLKIISSVTPRFDLFAKSNWLVYGDFFPKDLYICLIQTVVFVGLFFSIAILDFKKKEF